MKIEKGIPNQPLEAVFSDQLHNLTAVIKADYRKLGYLAQKWLSVYRVPPSEAEIQETLSDLYLTAATKLKKDPNLRIINYHGWLRRILFFICLKYAQKSIRNKAINKNISDFCADTEIYELLYYGFVDQDRKIFLNNLLRELPAKDKHLFELTLSGYTSDEIADKLKINSDAVRKRKSRCLSELRNKIGL